MAHRETARASAQSSASAGEAGPVPAQTQIEALTGEVQELRARNAEQAIYIAQLEANKAQLETALRQSLALTNSLLHKATSTEADQASQRPATSHAGATASAAASASASAQASAEARARAEYDLSDGSSTRRESARSDQSTVFMGGGGDGGRGGDRTNNGGDKERKGRGRRIWGYIGAALVGAAVASAAFVTFDKDDHATKVVRVDTNGSHGGNQGSHNGGTHHKTAEQKRVANLKFAESAKTVPGAVKRLHSTPENLKANIHGIMNMNHGLVVDHSMGSQSSQRTMFNPDKFGTVNGAEAVAFTSVSSDTYRNMNYERLTGHAVPAGMSEAQVLNQIESILTAPGTHFAMENPTGTFLNHGQRGENAFKANFVSYTGNTPVFTITTADGHKMYVKVSNLCLNILDKVSVTHKGTPVAPGHPFTPETPSTPNTPVTPVVPVPKPHPHPQPHPHPHPHPEKPHTRPKGDNGNSNPVQNGGTPDKPGKGPAGQPSDGSGFVQGETHPATPAPEATPAPLPNNPAPTGPAEQGTNNGPNQPTSPSTETGQTVPTPDPNPQG